MREILFRIKSGDKWIYGLPIRIKKNTVAFEGVFEDGLTCYDALCEKQTLCQFTGLTDRNGKKIFEGDIVVADFDYDKRKMEVVFYKGGFKLKSKNYQPYDYSIHDDDINPQLEVIGTIHDNKELLEDV